MSPPVASHAIATCGPRSPQVVPPQHLACATPRASLNDHYQKGRTERLACQHVARTHPTRAGRRPPRGGQRVACSVLRPPQSFPRNPRGLDPPHPGSDPHQVLSARVVGGGQRRGRSPRSGTSEARGRALGSRGDPAPAVLIVPAGARLRRELWQCAMLSSRNGCASCAHISEVGVVAGVAGEVFSAPVGWRALRSGVSRVGVGDLVRCGGRPWSALGGETESLPDRPRQLTGHA